MFNVLREDLKELKNYNTFTMYLLMRINLFNTFLILGSLYAVSNPHPLNELEKKLLPDNLKIKCVFFFNFFYIIFSPFSVG